MLAVGLLLLSRRLAPPRCAHWHPPFFFARPAHAPNGTTHRRVINPHAMCAFPELAVGFQRAIRVGLQLCEQASFQGRIFLGRTSRNGFGREISGFSSLFQVALDAG